MRSADRQGEAAAALGLRGGVYFTPGFNPPPANFADPTTIAMLQESYLFWRIKKGGVGLPIEGMPWKSAMPRWEVELPDEWIWKIIMGEYDGAHQSPRTWE